MGFLRIHLNTCKFMFKNRTEAARQLLPYLEKYRHDDGVVLAIPRGSVPMACPIASHLHFPVDLMMSKKIGYPGNPEYAIGSVSLSGRILDPYKEISEEYINKETLRIRQLLEKQYRMYMGSQKPLPLKGKTVILVDDGIATGFTMLEAIETVQEQMPGKIIVAVPVAPPDAVAFLRPRVNEIICLRQERDFGAVGKFYKEFHQVSDQEVAYRLQKSMSKPAIAA